MTPPGAFRCAVAAAVLTTMLASALSFRALPRCAYSNAIEEADG